MILRTKASGLFVFSESLVEKLKQLGSDIGGAIQAAVGAVAGTPKPVPIPVKVEN